MRRTRLPRFVFPLLFAPLAACAPVSSSPRELPSPDRLVGKADQSALDLRGALGYGDTRTGSLSVAGALVGYTFEALEAAALSADAQGRPLAVFGPEDASGTWGDRPIASSSAGDASTFTIPEDGRYAVLLGGDAGDYALSLSCSAGCDVDADAGKLLVNRADRAGLSGAGLDADALLAYRDQYGLLTTLDEVGLGGDARLSPALHRVFFASKVGAGWGWSPEAQARTAFLEREGAAEVDHVPGNVAVAVVDLFRRAQHEIDLVMYGFSFGTDEGTALLAAAARGVQIKVYLDVSERDPDGTPYSAGVITQLLATAHAEVKVPRYSSKTMHEKFGIVDGVHVFDGSANVSTKARDVYTEDRFMLMSSPVAAALFADEFDRLWNELGKDGALLVQP